MMMRVNLRPPEIRERRQAERRIGWVAFAAVVIGVVLLGVWAYGRLQVRSRADELAAIQQQVASTQAAAEQLAIFEARSTELQARREIVKQALSGRVAWARLFDELSLVMPSDVWLQTLAADETDGMQAAGYAVDAPGDSPDTGHATMAKLLVRLADLEQLYDVWLTSSEKTDFEEQPAIQFTVTARIKPEADGGDTP